MTTTVVLDMQPVDARPDDGPTAVAQTCGVTGTSTCPTDPEETKKCSKC